MRLERLLAIIVLLINRKMVTAKELADHFGVSIRTIYRDINAIGFAGIPVVPIQGIGGGYTLAQGFHLNRQCLSLRDMAAIITALKGVSSSLGDTSAADTIEKIRTLVPEDYQENLFREQQQVVFDFLPWGANTSFKNNLSLLRQAIAECRVVSFGYRDGKQQETSRTVEPITIICKMGTWYLFAFCRQRMETRIFKISRMRNCAFVHESFTPRDYSAAFRQFWSSSEEWIPVTLKVWSKGRAMMEEYLTKEEFIPLDDGTWKITIQFPHDETLYSILIAYQDTIRILEPREVQERFLQKLNSMMHLYL